MDNRLLTPTFLSNNMSYVQKELAKEGMELVKRTSDVPGIGITYEVQEIEGGGEV